MREKMLKPQNPEEVKLLDSIAEKLAGDPNKAAERIDELDDLSGPDLIAKLASELPENYRYHLDNCGGVINNNFPSDSDIRFTLRINREEQRSIDKWNDGGRERQQEFLKSPLGQFIIKMK